MSLGSKFSSSYARISAPPILKALFPRNLMFIIFHLLNNILETTLIIRVAIDTFRQINVHKIRFFLLIRQGVNHVYY